MYYELDRFFGPDMTVEEVYVGGKRAVLVNEDFLIVEDGRTFRWTKKGFKEVRQRFKKTSGYASTYYKGREMSTHRLIAWFFCENLKGRPEVNHINGIKTDNRASNLEWCTRSENMKHAYAMGLKQYSGGRGRVCLGR